MERWCILRSRDLFCFQQCDQGDFTMAVVTSTLACGSRLWVRTRGGTGHGAERCISCTAVHALQWCLRPGRILQQMVAPSRCMLVNALQRLCCAGPCVALHSLMHCRLRRLRSVLSDSSLGAACLKVPVLPCTAWVLLVLCCISLINTIVHGQLTGLGDACVPTTPTSCQLLTKAHLCNIICPHSARHLPLPPTGKGA